MVAKLLHIVEPDVAVFGRKDYQQWRLICRMVGGPLWVGGWQDGAAVHVVDCLMQLAGGRVLQAP